MRIVYVGTPDYACIPLDALIEAGHEVCLVVTQPDKPRDRGKKIQKSPVKARAEELGIAVYTPERLKDSPEALRTIEAQQPDFVVVYSYGKLIPKDILDVPKYGCINIHASLLPKYRGAAPIHRAVMNGEKNTGITIMRMEEGLDTGAVYAASETPIERKTSAELYTELSALGAKLLVESLPKIADGSLVPVPQEGESCYAGMVRKSEGEIDWSRSAEEIDCLVRGFNDFPVAWTRLGEQVFKIYCVEPCPGKLSGSAPGSVINSGKGGLEVACSDGTVIIKKLQAPGKKVMDAAEFLLGNKIEIGTLLG